MLLVPPPISAEINKSHPFSEGLDFFYIGYPDSFPGKEFVSGDVLTRQGGLLQCLDGGKLFDSTGVITPANSNKYLNCYDTNQITILGRWKIRASAEDTYYTVIVDRNSSSAGPGFMVWVAKTSTEMQVFTYSDTNMFESAKPSWDTYRNWGYTGKYGAQQEIIDGVVNATASNNINLSDPAAPIKLGYSSNVYGNFYHPDFVLQWVGIWDHVKPLSEIRKINIDPYGILKKVQFTLGATGDGTVSITPVTIASSESVGTPTISVGGVEVTPLTIASSEAVGTPTISVGGVSITPLSIASGESVGTPTISVGGVEIVPLTIASGEAVGIPTITGGTPSEDFVNIITGSARIHQIITGSARIHQVITGKARIGV